MEKINGNRGNEKVGRWERKGGTVEIRNAEQVREESRVEGRERERGVNQAKRDIGRKPDIMSNY